MMTLRSVMGAMVLGTAALLTGCSLILTKWIFCGKSLIMPN